MPEAKSGPRIGQRRAEWYVVLGVCAMIGAGAICWNISKIFRAPSTEEAMTRSLAELRIPELTIAYSLHPDTCSIKKTMWRWDVDCEGVPTHFYQDITLCDPGPPKTCGAMPPHYTNCRTYFWQIDLAGMPSDPIGLGSRRYASLEEKCKAKGTFSSDREEMARRGITPERVEMLDYAGWYTGKTRPIR